MGAFAARPGWRAVVVLFLATFAVPATAFAEQLYIGVAPNNFVTGNDASPGTLIRANDTDGSGVIVGDAYPSEQLTGYGGLAFDLSGNLWATVGKDDFGDIGSELGTLSSTLVQVDPANGTILFSAGIVKDSNDVELGITDLAFNSNSNAGTFAGTLFGISASTDIGGPCSTCIYSINSSTGAATLVGIPTTSAGQKIELDSLAFGPDGTLYGTGIPAKSGQTFSTLYTINSSNGAVLTAENVVRDPNDPYSTGNSVTPYGLAARPSDGTLFGTLCCSNQIVYRDRVSHLWRFLGSTGVSSDVYADLAFAPIPTPVPAAVWLFGSGLAALAGMRRRRSPDGANAGINRRA